MKIIPRDKYLQRIIELNGTPDIKIITGIRRSGKSKLMQAYIEYLKSHVNNCNIIYIDFMDLAFEEIKEYHALHAYVEAQYQANKVNYLFVDEVQMCPQFELAINSLYTKEKYDIYLTGSNAFLLSADLATLFTGRYSGKRQYYSAGHLRARMPSPIANPGCVPQNDSGQNQTPQVQLRGNRHLRYC